MGPAAVQTSFPGCHRVWDLKKKRLTIVSDVRSLQTRFTPGVCSASLPESSRLPTMCATLNATASAVRHASDGSARRFASAENEYQPATRERVVLRRPGRVSMPPALVQSDVCGCNELPAAVAVQNSVSPHHDFANPLGQVENDRRAEAVTLAHLSSGAGVLTRRQQRILHKALGGSQPTPALPNDEQALLIQTGLNPVTVDEARTRSDTN